MKRICYTEHLKHRMEIRDIQKNIPRDIYLNADDRYYDKDTGYYIAIKNVKFKGRLRDLIVAYEETSDSVNIVTIHPIKPNAKKNNIRDKRWRKL